MRFVPASQLELGLELVDPPARPPAPAQPAASDGRFDALYNSYQFGRERLVLLELDARRKG